MKKWMVLLGLGLQCFSVFAQEVGPGYHLQGSVSLMIPVTLAKMTNVVFPVPVAAGVKVSRDILAQKPKGVENVIELKALRRNFVPTNLSVYGKDGRLYSFNLRFVEDTAVLNYKVISDEWGSVAGHPVMLSGLPVDVTTMDRDAAVLSLRRGFLHGSVKSDGARLRLKGIYLRDSLMWVCLRLTNRTMIGFTMAYVRVFVGDRKLLKRTASQQEAILPVYQSRLEMVPGDGRRDLVLALAPMTVPVGKKLVVEIADGSGGRELVLGVKGRVVLRARSMEANKK